MNNNVSQIVEKFLSSLEKKVLDLQLQVENLKYFKILPKIT